MLVNLTGQERTEDEFRTLYRLRDYG